MSSDVLIRFYFQHSFSLRAESIFFYRSFLFLEKQIWKQITTRWYPKKVGTSCWRSAKINMIGVQMAEWQNRWVNHPQSFTVSAKKAVFVQFCRPYINKVVLHKTSFDSVQDGKYSST